MHRFSRQIRHAPLFCKATEQLLANIMQHGYNRVRLWDKVKLFSAPFMPTVTSTLRHGPLWLANGCRCSIRSDAGTNTSCHRISEDQRCDQTTPTCVGRWPPWSVPLLQRTGTPGNRTIWHCNSCSVHMLIAFPPAHSPTPRQSRSTALFE